MSLADELRGWIREVDDERASYPYKTNIFDDELLCLARALAVVEEIERAPDDDEAHYSNRLLALIRWRDRLKELVK